MGEPGTWASKAEAASPQGRPGPGLRDPPPSLLIVHVQLDATDHSSYWV